MKYIKRSITVTRNCYLERAEMPLHHEQLEVLGTLIGSGSAALSIRGNYIVCCIADFSLLLAALSPEDPSEKLVGVSAHRSRLENQQQGRGRRVLRPVQIGSFLQLSSSLREWRKPACKSPGRREFPLISCLRYPRTGCPRHRRAAGAYRCH